VVKILTNPMLLRALVVLFCASFAFVIGLIFIRLLRKSITEEADLSPDAPPSPETLPMHLYNTVIQELKQQKHELHVQSQAEQHRARVTETFSQAVLSNLSCGVLVFGTNGLVKTSNPAAKEILGFASTTGMNAEGIFRGAFVRSGNLRQDNLRNPDPGDGTPPELGCFPDETTGEPVRLSDEVDAVLHGGSKRRQVQAEYETPAGQQRFLAVTVSPVPAAEEGLLGVACLINDLSELEHIRRQQALHGEMSAEMALELRTSLTTISGYAQQLANNRDPELAQQLAADIAAEALRLDRSLGGFLTEKRAPKVMAANAGSNGCRG
jgi:nitrogen fixation/metabolism regulation signal transduction histidine kinase